MKRVVHHEPRSCMISKVLCSRSQNISEFSSSLTPLDLLSSPHSVSQETCSHGETSANETYLISLSLLSECTEYEVSSSLILSVVCVKRDLFIWKKMCKTNLLDLSHFYLRTQNTSCPDAFIRNRRATVGVDSWFRQIVESHTLILSHTHIQPPSNRWHGFQIDAHSRFTHTHSITHAHTHTTAEQPSAWTPDVSAL